MKILHPLLLHIIAIGTPTNSFSTPAHLWRISKGADHPIHHNHKLFASSSSEDSIAMVPELIDDETNNNRSKVTRFNLKGLLSAARKVQIVPAGLSLLIGFYLGRKLGPSPDTSFARPTSIMTKAREWPLVSILLVAFGIKEIWFAIPNWIKRNIPWGHGHRGRHQGNAQINGASRSLDSSMASSSSPKDHNYNDLTSLPAVSAKLQSLFTMASEKLKTTSEERKDLQIAFLVWTLIVTQIKAKAGNVRDEGYALDGTALIGRDNDGLAPTHSQKNDDAAKLLIDLKKMFEFADWAYDELPNEQRLEEAMEQEGFTLLRHDKTDLPGYVSHYVAISKEQKTVLIGIKGTSNLGDILTDCCGLVVAHELDSPYIAGGNTTIHCHEGIVLSAQRLFAKLDLLMEEFILPTGYTTLVTGHSLGAGVAALVGIFMRSRFAALRQDSNASLLRVVAFASPPVLDCDSALACRSFVTTIVNNADIIPRASLSNLVVLTEFLKVLDDKLENSGMKPKDLVSASQFLFNLTKTDSEMIMSLEEIIQGFEQAWDQVDLRDPDHLYVPGKVLHMYDLWSKDKEGSKSMDTAATTFDSSSTPALVRTAERAQWTDGTSRVLRMMELDGRFLSDHLSPAYRSSLQSLLEIVQS